MMHVVLFGAGHVGHALVKVLGTLPCVVQWVDARDELFPDEVPANVQVEATDLPDAIVDEAPAGAYFIVMTHDHALDFSLTQRIMRRDDFAYFGLIGSKTKRVKFERRLLERGVAASRRTGWRRSPVRSAWKASSTRRPVRSRWRSPRNCCACAR